MMYDDNFLYSFCDRVKKNYEALKDSEFEVTMLLCSFIGVVATINDEKWVEIFGNVKFSKELRQKIIIHDDKNIFKHIRNSLCHLKISKEYIHAENKQITQIQLKDRNNFECTLTVAELEELFYEVVAIIHEKTKKQEG